MKINERGKAPFYLFDSLSDICEISHFISSRKGGVSENAYNSLNIGFGTDDEYSNVLENRRIMADSVGIPLESFIMLNQVHKTNIAIIFPEMKGMGAIKKENAIRETDAMITSVKGICLYVMAADCVSILFYDPVKQVIGAAHAGWRGTVDKIASLTVLKMQETYGCNPTDILVGIGPSIGPCCYNVGSDVIDSAMNAFGTTDRFIRCGANFMPHFDLWYANKYQLLQSGIPEAHIEIAGICTMCESHNFFSSRVGKGVTGRFGAGIMLNN